MHLKDCKKWHGLPIANERAPSVYPEVTPVMRGGDMEKKIKSKKSSKQN